MTLKKQSSMKWITGICLLIVVFSCRKNLSGNQEEDNSTNIGWAKNYFNQSLLPKQGNQVNYKNISNTAKVKIALDQQNFKTPLWLKGRNGATSRYQFVEVPLKYTSKRIKSIGIGGDKIDRETIKASFDRLIIYKNSQGLVDQRIVTYMPDKKYLDKHNGDASHNKIEKLDPDFSGYLTYSSWEGNVLFRIRIENGRSKRIGRINKKTK